MFNELFDKCLLGSLDYYSLIVYRSMNYVSSFQPKNLLRPPCKP